jgi:hypothetical protein
VSWGQITLNGEAPDGPEAFAAHSTWSWTGEPVRLARQGSRPETGSAAAVTAEAARLARGILQRALEIEGARDHDIDLPGQDVVFTVSDGIRFWSVAILEFRELPRPLILFAGEAPPADRRLVISEAPTRLLAPHADTVSRRGAVCFTPGTRIATETGTRLIEELVAGDRVLTRDDGPQEILWVGSKRISGARLHAFPDLRPVRVGEGALGEGRPEGDLIVSPDHRLLLTGPRAQAVWGESEVLVAARDLIDDTGILRAHDLREVTYVHLLMPTHQILFANGVPAESFHPGDADLDMVPEAQRLRLLDVVPDALRDPEAYGPRARSVLGSFEAAALIPRH